MDREWSQKERIQLGMAHIFKGLNHKKVIDQMSVHRIPLKFHPFGLDININERDDFSGRMYFIGDQGLTDISVRAMISHIHWAIAESSPESVGLRYLRIIYAQCDAQKIDAHQVYFELGCRLGVFICSGCTDCSGQGSFGTFQLENIFYLLSSVYGINIEKVVIEYVFSEKVYDYIDKISQKYS